MIATKKKVTMVPAIVTLFSWQVCVRNTVSVTSASSARGSLYRIEASCDRWIPLLPLIRI